MLLAYLLLTALALLFLLLLLLRTGMVRPMSVWSLAALMPLMVALTAALDNQARAKRVLSGYQPEEVAAVIQTGDREYDVMLDARQAACLERTLRLRTEADLVLPDESAPIPVRTTSKVIGDLPKQQFVEALSVRGILSCKEFKHLPPEEAKAPEKKQD